MNALTNKRPKGFAGLQFTREEMLHPLFIKILHAAEEERHMLRAQLEDVSDIGTTTLLRGELRMVKKFLARTSEVGPESRQGDSFGAASAFPPVLT